MGCHYLLQGIFLTQGSNLVLLHYSSGQSLSCVWLFATPWTVAHQAPLSMGFSRQEYWNGLPCPLPGDLPNPGIKPRSPALQANSWCRKLNAVSPKSILNLNPCVMVFESGALGRWLGHEGGALMNEISALKKGTSESSLAPSARWRHSKMLAIYEPESGLSPDAESIGALILGFSVSWILRNNFLFFLSYPVYLFVITVLNELGWWPPKKAKCYRDK